MDTAEGRWAPEPPGKCEVRLDQVVRSIVRELQPAHPVTRVTISELPVVDADPAVVLDLLTGVIASAFRHSALVPHPAVEISIDATGAFQVMDNGPGAPNRFAISFED